MVIDSPRGHPMTSVVAIIDLCFSHGNNLLELCNNIRTSDVILDRILTQIKTHWLRTSVQLEFLRRVWSSLDGEYRSIQEQIIQLLVDRLNAANTSIGRVIAKDQTGERVQPRSDLRLWESLTMALDDLEAWKQTFDPSWFLAMRVQNSIIDQQLHALQLIQQEEILTLAQDLRKSLIRQSVGSEPTATRPTGKPALVPFQENIQCGRVLGIPFCSAKMTQQNGSPDWLILDAIPIHPQADTSRLTNDTQALATKLSSVDPNIFGLLKCHGASVTAAVPSAQSRTSSCRFLYSVPSGMSEPSTLRGSLIKQSQSSAAAAPPPDYPLSDRFRIAKELARSVCYIHTHGIVHRNIRPETILLLRKDRLTLGSAFLIGFEDFHSADGRPLLSGDHRWEQNLYRHPPQRQRLSTGKDCDRYLMQHDIYSLGVCLLELGLWESFVAYGLDGSTNNAVPAPILKNLAARNTNSNSSSNSNHNNSSTKSSDGNGNQLGIKDYLVSLARNDLSKRMGKKYAGVVETCLTCLDEDNVDFGDEREFQDREGILVAVRYIEKVILPLDSISI